MSSQEKQTPNGGAENRLPHAPTGNASNPNPQDPDVAPQTRQLIDERGEKYLREVAAPEDYPDPQDAEEMDRELDGTKD